MMLCRNSPAPLQIDPSHRAHCPGCNTLQHNPASAPTPAGNWLQPLPGDPDPSTTPPDCYAARRPPAIAPRLFASPSVRPVRSRFPERRTQNLPAKSIPRKPLRHRLRERHRFRKAPLAECFQQCIDFRGAGGSSSGTTRRAASASNIDSLQAPASPFLQRLPGCIALPGLQ